MLTFQCPSCGAEVVFKSKTSVFSICSYCQTTLVRHDMNLATLGKMAELPEDMSPLQVYSRGDYQGTAFEVVGRLRVGWEDGFWNEWYVLLDDGRDGWLAEAQGFWMMSFDCPEIEAPPLENLQPGTAVTLGSDQSFTVDDIKKTTCIGSEGELPFKAPQGRKATAVDVSGPDNLFGTLDYSDDGAHVYLGRYVDFEQLRFTGLREFDGW